MRPGYSALPGIIAADIPTAAACEPVDSVNPGRIFKTLSDEIRIDAALSMARNRLEAASESPQLDAELLMSQALNVTRSYLFAHPEDTLDITTAKRFFSAVKRREAGEPLAYIHGNKEFWSLPLMVSPATLVPRPETEVLVQEALTMIPPDGPYRILDLGTGSGAIALAIASERPQALLVATDVCAHALAIARENARQLEFPNIAFVGGDWIEPVGGQQFDMIVCNPPYVRACDPALLALTYEPQAALAAGEDGLQAIRRLASECLRVTHRGSVLLMEHGADQETEVASLLRQSGWQDIRCLRDLAGLPRVTIAVAAAAAFEECRGHGS